jgi:hypothetical protein
MKKYFVLLFVSMFSLLAVAQTKVTSSYSAPKYVYFGGSTSDTLYASDTLIWSIRVGKDFAQRCVGRYEITKVTGTVSDTVYFYGSFDGTSRDVAIDSIFNSNVSTGNKFLTVSRWTNFAYPYLLIWSLDKGGAKNGVKSVRKLSFNSANN